MDCFYLYLPHSFSCESLQMDACQDDAISDAQMESGKSIHKQAYCNTRQSLLSLFWKILSLSYDDSATIVLCQQLPCHSSQSRRCRLCNMLLLIVCLSFVFKKFEHQMTYCPSQMVLYKLSILKGQSSYIILYLLQM